MESSGVQDGDKAKELAVCGLATPVDRGRDLLRSGILMLSPCRIAGLLRAVEGRRSNRGDVRGLRGDGVGICGDLCGTRSYCRLATAFEFQDLKIFEFFCLRLHSGCTSSRDSVVLDKLSRRLIKTMYGMQAVHTLRHTCTCDRIAGTHNPSLGRESRWIWDVRVSSQIKRINEAAATSARGLKQATTTTLRELFSRGFITMVNDSIIKATSVDISMIQ